MEVEYSMCSFLSRLNGLWILYICHICDSLLCLPTKNDQGNLVKADKCVYQSLHSLMHFIGSFNVVANLSKYNKKRYQCWSKTKTAVHFLQNTYRNELNGSCNSGQ